jgi:hypothetical protein
MKRLLEIDKAVFEVDDDSRVFKFLGKNPKWRQLTPEENEANKKSIDGYIRKFSKTGKMKKYSVKQVS